MRKENTGIVLLLLLTMLVACTSGAKKKETERALVIETLLSKD